MTTLPTYHEARLLRMPSIREEVSQVADESKVKRTFFFVLTKIHQGIEALTPSLFAGGCIKRIYTIACLTGSFIGSTIAMGNPVLAIISLFIFVIIDGFRTLISKTKEKSRDLNDLFLGMHMVNSSIIQLTAYIHSMLGKKEGVATARQIHDPQLCSMMDEKARLFDNLKRQISLCCSMKSQQEFAECSAQIQAIQADMNALDRRIKEVMASLE